MDFQLRILCVLARNREFTLLYGAPMLRPTYFDNSAHADIARVVVDFFVDEADRSKLPEESTVRQMIRDHLRSIPAKRSQIPEYMEILDELYGLPIEDIDVDYVTTKFREFCKIQAFKLAAQESLRKIEARQFDAVPQLFQDAVLVGEDLTNVPSSHIEGFADRMCRYRKGELEESAMRVPSLIASIDRATRGGWGPGEITGVMAPSGLGKTRFMVHCGSSAMETGRNVYHATLEISKSILEELYDCRLTTTQHHLMLDRLDEMEDAMYTRVQEQVQGDLRIQEWNPGELDMPTLANAISILEMQEGFTPDLIIVDYLNLMAPAVVKNRSYKSRYDEVLWIHRDFRSLCRKRQVPGLSPSQQQRSSWQEEIFHGDVVSECIGAYETSDCWICMLQTPEEEESGRMRLLVDKLRRNKRRMSVTCKVDLSTCFFRDISLRAARSE